MRMKKIDFDSVFEVYRFMKGIIEDGECVTAVLGHDSADALFRACLFDTDLKTGFIDFEPANWGYDLEYYVTLSDDNMVSVEKAWDGKRYLIAESDVVLFDRSIDSAVLEKVCGDVVIEVSIGGFESGDCDCCRCCTGSVTGGGRSESSDDVDINIKIDVESEDIDILDLVDMIREKLVKGKSLKNFKHSY